jgi:hypothetical protein
MDKNGILETDKLVLYNVLHTVYLLKVTGRGLSNYSMSASISVELNNLDTGGNDQDSPIKLKVS